MSNINAFMTSAKKSRHEQSVIQKAQPEEELVSINVRIPKLLRTKIRQHRVETDESLTALVRRLLEDELD
ncbi:hypothetical protein GIR35_12325 [Enterococcus faecalis]|nr:hypothetical protein GIR35_12325 [Enterococcus faecalis]